MNIFIDIQIGTVFSTETALDAGIARRFGVPDTSDEGQTTSDRAEKTAPKAREKDEPKNNEAQQTPGNKVVYNPVNFSGPEDQRIKGQYNGMA